MVADPGAGFRVSRLMSRFVLLACSCLIACAALAVEAGLQPIPALTSRVTDLTGTLDGSQRQAIEADLAALEQRKGAQLAVLIVPTTQPEDIAQYAIRVYDAWKLGRKNIDDGALLIIAKEDRSMRIEVARGLEGAIPDAAAARILREYLTPRFREGDFNGGIRDALGAMIGIRSRMRSSADGRYRDFTNGRAANLSCSPTSSTAATRKS